MTIEMSEAAGGKGAGGKRNSRASKTVAQSAKLI